MREEDGFEFNNLMSNAERRCYEGKVWHGWRPMFSLTGPIYTMFLDSMRKHEPQGFKSY